MVCPAINIVKNKLIIAASLFAFILFLAVVHFCPFFIFFFLIDKPT
ncbi:hypothetical protein D929_00554 [Enterococcus faecalis 02-MB-P-10]|nr:hypothetical protein D929_00554 [Enterococcus faecalis 02-MB-P-10]